VARFDGKLVFAIANLAWRFFLHHLARLSPFRERRGIARFRENYVHEGLPPRTTTGRALVPHASRCTSCGFCDGHCPLLVDPHHAETAAAPFMGPRAFVLSAVRAAPHYADVRDVLDTMTSTTCTGCALCVAECPERIPILALAEMCKAELAVVDAARAARTTGGA